METKGKNSFRVGGFKKAERVGVGLGTEWPSRSRIGIMRDIFFSSFFLSRWGVGNFVVGAGHVQRRGGVARRLAWASDGRTDGGGSGPPNLGCVLHTGPCGRRNAFLPKAPANLWVSHF